jgi:hypothetical protein
VILPTAEKYAITRPLVDWQNLSPTFKSGSPDETNPSKWIGGFPGTATAFTVNPDGLPSAWNTGSSTPGLSVRHVI